MTKAQLIKALALQANLSQAQAESAIDGLSVVISNELRTAGNEVALVGVGKLKSVAKAPRELMAFGTLKQLPARTVVKFSISSVLKSQL